MRTTDSQLAERIRRATRARKAELGDRIQSLWGGYGEIRRIELEGATRSSAILKRVTPPEERALGRDAAKLRSHRRKLRSYAVELAFYRSFSEGCATRARLPALLFGDAAHDQFLFVLEDLDEAGFPERRRRCTQQEIDACLAWLAAFHASFLGTEPTGLWQVGSYWHLATRPDELAALGKHPLRSAAPRIDQRLSQARFRTLVHGDAKLENFCFATRAPSVAVVDFQYVGGGVGVKDVAYFLSSCFSANDCAAHVPHCLDVYFEALRARLPGDVDGAALEAEWRELFAWAWVDFFRFLLGWAPSYAEGDEYSEALTRQVLALP